MADIESGSQDANIWLAYVEEDGDVFACVQHIAAATTEQGAWDAAAEWIANTSENLVWRNWVANATRVSPVPIA